VARGKFRKIYLNAILKSLSRAKRPLTTNQISDRLGISWGTAEKYLQYLHTEGYLKKEYLGNRIYWKANR
jgi:Mn-dependent DtxR family transcriptional regulator